MGPSLCGPVPRHGAARARARFLAGGGTPYLASDLTTEITAYSVGTRLPDGRRPQCDNSTLTPVAELFYDPALVANPAAPLGAGPAPASRARELRKRRARSGGRTRPSGSVQAEGPDRERSHRRGM